jgi:F-type H+-transporting ATPase subunit b
VLIDWFTVFAQILNFLILVGLLKRFLYGPIIRAMDEREARIAARQEEARLHIEAAERETRLYREKTRELEASRLEMMETARQEADARRRELLSRVREEVLNRRAAWFEALQQEKAAFLHDLRLHAGAKFLQISRQALGELAGAELERRILHVFLERFREMADTAGPDFPASLARSGSRVAVTSSFEIPEDLRSLIEDTFRSRIATECSFHYETSPDLLCGIELKTDGVRVAWSLQDYLGELEKELNLEFIKRPVFASMGEVEGTAVEDA